jgi:hypothetical protein
VVKVDVDTITKGREVEVVLNEFEIEEVDVVVVVAAVREGMDAMSSTSSQYMDCLSFPP